MKVLFTAVAASLLLVSACATTDKPDPAAVQPAQNEARPQSTANAEALAEFNQRVTAYSALHKKLEATLPTLPKETTPEIIHKHQRALEKLMMEARKDAKQ